MIDDDNDLFLCLLCGSRPFATRRDLLQHCGSKVHVSKWCKPCEWLFVKESSRGQHLLDSPFHHVCDECYEEYGDANQLNMVSRSRYVSSACIANA